MDGTIHSKIMGIELPSKKLRQTELVFHLAINAYLTALFLQAILNTSDKKLACDTKCLKED